MTRRERGRGEAAARERECSLRPRASPPLAVEAAAPALEAARRAFFDAHGTVLLAFAAPFALAMALPLVGPLVFVLAQAAIAIPLAAVLGGV